MTLIDTALILGGPLALLTLSYGIPALVDRLPAIGEGRAEYVEPSRRHYLLDVTPATTPHLDVLHGISGWQSLLSSLRIKAPHALCGESLVGDERTGEDDRGLPMCPRCLARARWMQSTPLLQGDSR